MLTFRSVIVRRVVEARQIAADGGFPGATGARSSAQQSGHGHAHSVSRTPALTEKEKNLSDSLQGGGGPKKKKQGFWSKLKCW